MKYFIKGKQLPHVFSMVFVVCILLLLLFLFCSCAHPNEATRMIIYDNDQYIAGDYSCELPEDIVTSFFPSYNNIKEIATIEYRYCTLGNNAELDSILYSSEHFRSLFNLELTFDDENDYQSILNSSIEDREVFFGGVNSKYYGYVVLSEFTSFPERVAFLMCNDDMKTLNYMLFVDTTYNDSKSFLHRIITDIPAEWWSFYSSNEYLAVTSMLKYKIPTGSNTIGRCTIIDNDEYGRVLYKSSISGIMLSDVSEGTLYAYLITQITDQENVLFYDDVCILLSVQNYNKNDDEIQALKQCNDWGQNIDISKCCSKKILPYEIFQSVAYNKHAMVSCISSYLNTDSFVYDVCDQNSDGKILVFVREKKHTECNSTQVEKTYVMVIGENKNGTYDIVQNGFKQIGSILEMDLVNAVKNDVNW